VEEVATTNVASTKHLLFWLLLSVAVVITLAPSVQALAKVSPKINAISLSPFLQNVTITASDTTKTFELELTNHSPNLQELDLTTHDFGSLNDSGGIILEGNNDSYAQNYGLAAWLRLENDTVVLKPGESRQVQVNVDNRPDMQPGGHYGAVVASVKNLDDRAGNRVIVNQQLLSLVLVDKQGGEHYNLKLSSVEQNGNWLHLPDDIKLHFQNPGNVHVTPRGLVLLKSPTGTVIARGVINSDSAYILPATFRDMYVRMQPVGHAIPLPGIYHVEVQFRYDGIAQTASKSYAVHFINLKLYAGIILIVLLGFIVYRIKRKSNKSNSKSVANTG
jgi:hypothetical protein